MKQDKSTAKQEGEEGETFLDEDASTDAREGAEGEFSHAKDALDGVQLCRVLQMIGGVSGSDQVRRGEV